MEDTTTPHVAILPSPGMGHLIPLAELARHLVHTHNLSVTVISASNDPSRKAQDAVAAALPTNVNAMSLPPVSTDDLPPHTNIETTIITTMLRSLPSLRQALRTLASTTRLVALIADLFGPDAFDVAREFGVAPYLFFTSSAMGLSFCLHLPALDQQYSGEYRDMPEPLELPGCVPLHGKDFVDPVQDRKNEGYRLFLRNVKRFREADGILVNSFEELQPSCVKALREDRAANFPPIYPVGPLTRRKESSSSSTSHDQEYCLRWLDKQPRGSVLFVCFGSGGTLTAEQLHELALGLEMSEQRFLWVARCPNDKDAGASFFGGGSSKDPLAFLPRGFEARTKHVGVVIPWRAPQVQVLSHKSTGGFITHCGWNSTLESIVHGVPMIAWPLYAEQKMNAVMMVGELKVALRPAADERGMVGREEIAGVVKCLMEGEEGKRLRRRMEELKVGSAKALAEAEAGSSYTALSGLAGKWKRNIEGRPSTSTVPN
ncbi:hypothetical protein ACLOJK_041306 [Asimina triloba]